MNRQRMTAALWLTALILASLPVFAAEGRRTVNVNTADATQLAYLPRVGPSTAQRIVEFRKKNGPFKAAEDLMLVQGIGERTFALIKPYLATSGETTLAEKVRAGKGKAREREKPEPKGEAKGEPSPEGGR